MIHFSNKEIPTWAMTWLTTQPWYDAIDRQFRSLKDAPSRNEWLVKETQSMGLNVFTLQDGRLNLHIEETPEVVLLILQDTGEEP